MFSVVDWLGFILKMKLTIEHVNNLEVLKIKNNAHQHCGYNFCELPFWRAFAISKSNLK